MLTALFSKLSGSALSSDVAGKIFTDQAPEGTDSPYIVISIVSDIPDDVFGKRGGNVLIQFSIFSTSEGLAEITNIYNDLKTLFDDCSMTITSNTLIWMHRTNLTSMMDEIITASGTASCRHWAVDYEILTQES